MESGLGQLLSGVLRLRTTIGDMDVTIGETDAGSNPDRMGHLPVASGV